MIIILSIIKELAEEFEKQFNCSIPIEKEVTKTDKKGNKITNLLTMENLWQAHNQIM